MGFNLGRRSQTDLSPHDVAYASAPCSTASEAWGLDDGEISCDVSIGDADMLLASLRDRGGGRLQLWPVHATCFCRVLPSDCNDPRHVALVAWTQGLVIDVADMCSTWYRTTS